MIDALPPVLEGYTLTFVSNDDEDQVEALLVHSADYLDLVAGMEPSRQLAHDLLTVLPEGKEVQDKVLLGLWNEQTKLIGILDTVRDHPTEGTWFLGLLLLEPAQRGQGVGEKLYRTFEGWASKLGAKEIRLSVAEQNEPAMRFWRRLGFLELERRPPEMFGKKESVFIVMRRVLG